MACTLAITRPLNGRRNYTTDDPLWPRPSEGDNACQMRPEISSPFGEARAGTISIHLLDKCDTIDFMERCLSVKDQTQGRLSHTPQSLLACRAAHL